MVTTRAQASQTNLPREDEMDGEDDFDDNASDLSLPGIGSRTFEIESFDRNYEDQEKDHERVRIERRFNEMSRQIGELTTLVRTLTEKTSSSIREGNGNNSPRSRLTSHSDTFGGCHRSRDGNEKFHLLCRPASLGQSIGKWLFAKTIIVKVPYVHFLLFLQIHQHQV